MADNIAVGGNTIATDDVGGAHYQRAKLVWGADGAVNDASAANPVPVTVTAVAAGDNNIGNVDVLSIAAGNNNIGDVDIASIAAGDNNIGNVDVLSIAAGTNSIGGTTDNGPHWTSVHGVAGAPFVSANASAADAAVTDAPVAGQKLVITDLIFSVDTAMSVTFKLETSGAVVLGPYYFPANSLAQITPRGKLKLATADKKLMVRTSVAGNITVDAFTFSEA